MQVLRWFYRLNWKQKLYLFIILFCIFYVATITIQIVIYVLGG